MNHQKPTIIQRVVILALIVSMSLSSVAFIPQKVQAQGAVQNDCGIFSFNCTMDHLKEFVLNKLAVTLANQLLQKMTASIVNWINTGFNGSPAFLTNPEAFFLDVGDQVTGEFLDKEGFLSQLCSPFSFDLRLNLALNQSIYATKRYECTLGKIVGNTRNAIATAGQNSGVTISGDPNGATIGNFVNGDFSQGGWASYIAYTTEPQNNAFGAYLMAQSDLQARIADKKEKVNTDLNRGQGFLSWQKCTDVTSQYLDPSLGGESVGLTAAQEAQFRQFGDQTVITGKNALDKPTSVQKKRDPKTGIVSYQDCQTSTPGSVIASSLQRQLNVPADKLVLVKTISDSIDAMLGALVNQMFTQGLAALSGRGSSVGGGNRSYLVQLSEEAESANSAGVQSVRNTGGSASDAIVNVALNNSKTYEQAIDLLNSSKTYYLQARQCFVTKLATMNLLRDEQKNYAENQIRTIDIIITTNIDPLIASTTIKKLEARRQADLFEASLNTSTITPSFTTNDIDSRFSRLDSAVNA
ncbi:MAG: hypothetical protein RL536_581, partial [Candidatus Parcubacteria bacterium]